MILMPSVTASTLWAIFFGLHMASLVLSDTSTLHAIPIVFWELCWTTVLAFVVMLPAGILAYAIIRLWRRHLATDCS